MSTSNQIAVFEKDPFAELDYGIDWSAWLNGATIASSAWILPSQLTKVDESNSSTLALVRISGGRIGASHRVQNQIVASNGEQDARSILIKVVNR